MKRLAALIWLTLNAFQSSYAQPTIDPAVTIELSQQITQAVSVHDVDRAVAVLGRAMMSPTTAETMRSHFANLKQFGNSQYIDRVYLRDFGKTTRDIIYKVKFDEIVIYFRYLFSVDAGSWRLLKFDFVNEGSLPFPKEWTHIYPG